MLILTVDDDLEDQEFFTEAIRVINPEIECLTFDNSEQAMHYLTDEAIVHPDFIFLDVNMPKMNGKECLRLIKATKSVKHIPVVMYSTTSAPHEIEAYVELGGTFLKKASTFEELVAALKGVLYPTNDGSGTEA